MLLHVPDVLTADQVGECRRMLDTAEWIDGRSTAGYQSAQVKDNQQVAEDSAIGRQVGSAIVRALQTHPLFLSAALPLHVFPPLFNRYAGGQAFGTHVDNAIRQVPGSLARIRTDLSCTLFLSSPDEYDGGELVVEDNYGVHRVKLASGHMVLYPSTSLHHVTPVTRGARIAAFFWVQSLIRDDARRTLLFDLDASVRQLAQERIDHPVAVQLTGVYHNLLRQWAEL